jgi:hypothetical protein
VRVEVLAGVAGAGAVDQVTVLALVVTEVCAEEEHLVS